MKSATAHGDREANNNSSAGCGQRAAIALVMAALIATPIWLWYAFVAETQDPYVKAQFGRQVVTLCARRAYARPA